MTDVVTTTKDSHTVTLNNGKTSQPLNAGRPNTVKAKAGENYRILQKAKTGEEQLLDNVIAKKTGDDLVLNYADGIQLTLENFYGECRAGGCDITLAGQDAVGYIINGETPAGVALGDGSTLAYAQGSHDTLMGMAQGNTALSSTLTGLQGAEIAYIPAASGIGSLGLLAVLGGGLGVTAGAGGGGGGVAAATPDVAAAVAVRNIVTVSVVAGPVVADNDLVLKLYQADGVTFIGGATVSLNGISTIDVGSYVGVILAKLNDTGTNPDYMDEATGLRVNLTGDLMAIGVANGGTIYLNLNVLTTLAAMKAGAIFSGASTAVITADVVTQTNAAVANAFGLTDLMGETVITTVDISGATNVNFTPETLTFAEKYGAILAALSGADAANAGNVQTTINALFSGLTVAGSSATLSTAALEVIVAGAHAAAVTASGTGASSLTAIVSSALVQENASVGIDRIATDGLISLSEKNSVITGTTVAGASVNLSMGGNTRAATVSGATWSYTLVDADITAMGQGGETLSATATLATGGTASTRRSVVVDTIALAPVINAVATDDIINATEVGSTITGSNEAGATVTLSIGGTVRAATVSGTSWSYTLVAADISAMGEGAEALSATQTDAAGNASAVGTRSITVATAAPAPTVSGVAIASATGIANSTLNAGDVLSVTVTMSGATNVVTSGGTPTLALVMGTTTVQAAYASGSGSTALVFTYTILANQTDTDGISIAANSLALNGGTLRDAAGNAVTLTHTAVAANTGYLVDTLAPTNQDTVFAAAVSKTAAAEVTIVSSGDATGSVWLAPAGTTSFVAGATMTTASGTASSILAPATNGAYQLYVIDAAGNVSSASTSTLTVAPLGAGVSGVAIASATGMANSTLNAGDVLSVTVTMSEATNVVTSGGTPTLALVMGTTTVQAAYASGSGSTALVFTYTILANQTDTDGISIAANSLALNGGTLADAAGNAVTLTHTAVAANTGYLVDTLAPTNQDTVFAAAVSKAADEAVTIVSSGDATGSVWLAPAGTTSFVAGATMTTASGTASSILAPATDGLYQLYVIDAAGNVSSASTSTLTVASTGYRVTGIAITGATGIANNSLNANDVVSVTVTMSEATTVVLTGGRPTLALLMGTTTVQAAYASGSGSTALVFTYTILANQNQMDTDGISIAANSLALAGGTLKNAAGDAASLTHRDVAANTGYLVDTVAPTNQNTLLANSVIMLGGTTVTITSPNEVNGSVWLAPAYTSTLLAGPTMTTASGMATSIQVPTQQGDYYLYVVDAAGNRSNYTTPTPNSVRVLNIKNSSGAYSASTNTLVLTGEYLNTLLATGEPLTTDIKARLDWSKLSWDINGDNDTTANVSFALEDIVSAKVSSPNGSAQPQTLLSIVLTQDKGLSLETTSGFAGTAPLDTLDIAAGFHKDAAGIAVTTDAAVNAALSFTAPTNQNAVYAASAIKTPDAVVAIVSTGDAANSVWFAPANTTNFVAGATMTTAGGTATSILAPTTAGTYRLYVIDAVGKVSSASSAGLWVTTSVDTTAPTVTNLSGAYSASTYTLTLTGTNYMTLLESSGLFESPTTNIKDRLDWSKLSWDINGDDDTTANVSFALEDIASANASNFPGLTIVLTSAKGASLEATSGFAGATPDTLDIAAGFDRDLSGNAATTDAKANAGLSFTAPTSTYIQPIFSSNVTKGASSAVTIVSSGNAANSIWFAPAGTTIFVAGTTMTTAGGTATSILAPASDGAYKLYLLDVLGNVSPASNGTLTVDATAPTATITSGNYASSTNTLVLTGTNYSTLLESNESAATDIKARLDWSKLTWDINGDDNTTGNVSFTLTDITSAKVTNGTTLAVVLASDKGASLEATSGFGGATLDTLDIQAGFAKDTWGNVATTDVAANAPLTFTAPTNQSTVFSSAATRKGAAAVTISSSGDAGNSVWFAPADTTSFVAGDTMTTAGGTATSILAPNTGGIYKLFVIDAAGARSGASTSSLTVDTTPPSVSGIAITTATGRLNNTLNAGDVVSVTVTMSEATTVVTTGGRPTLDLLIGETPVKAAYASGTGTTALVFTYTILANQTDPDGISIVANSLALNGGTFSDAVGNAATTLTHTAVAANALYLVDNTAPTISGVAITSATGLQNNTLNVGDVVSVTLTMSEASTVSSSNAKLMLNLNGNSVGAAYTSGNNSTALVFKYTIQAGDTDTNGISILANNLQLNSSTLSDLAGNNLVTPTFSAVADDAGYLVDTTAPSNQTTVFAANAILPGSAAVTIVSANEADGSVWFAPLNTTSFVSGATKTTAGGTATSILAPATDGDYKLYVIDAAGNVSAASGPTLTVDGTAPTFSTFSISGTGWFSNTYNAGDVLTVGMAVSETINVDTTGGSPTLALQIGTATVQAAYTSGSGSRNIIFTYTIQAGDTDTNGISILANSLALNGATLRDAAGNAATLTHAAVADNILFKVDTTAPVNQDAVLASNVSKRPGTLVTIASAGETNGTVFLAPAGTTDFFVTSDTIKSNAGTATTVPAPSIEGVYQLFVMDAARNVSVASTASLTVDNTAPTNQNDVFTAAVSKKGGSGITINAANEVGGSVWFAPSTTLTTATFTASATMTTAGGTATSILAPANAGSYKLFVIDAAGNVSSGSTVVLTVDNVAPTSATAVGSPITTTPVKGGATVTIGSSGESPNSVWLAPSGTLTTATFVESDTMTKAVNGVATTIVAPATTGAYKVYVIDAAGNVSTASNNTLNVDATAPTNQSTVFAADVSKKGLAAVTIVSSGDSTNNVWLAPDGTTSFVAGSTMTKATNGSVTSILAPATEGSYKLFVIDAVGNVSSASTATLAVDNTAPSNQDTVFSGSVAVKAPAAVTIVSSGDASNSVWLAPSGTTSFVASTTKTKATDGTATSILAPTVDGAYKLFLIDVAGNVSSASTSTLTVDNTAPTNQSTVLGVSKIMKGGAAVTIVSSGDATNSVWLAPQGTTSFVAGDTMTKATEGTATSMLAPATEGAYRLFLIDALGNLSSPSGGILTVDNTAPINQNTVFTASVSKNGGVAVTIVSSGDTSNSVWLAPAGTTSFVAGATMTKAANGTQNQILAPATEGAYQLFVLDEAGNISNASTSTLTVDNTAPSNQDTVFAANATKKGAATVTIVSSGDATNTVWLAPAGTTSFVAGTTMTKAANGTASSILAPATAGAYQLFVIDATGNISSASTSTLTVDNTAPTNASTVFATAALKMGAAEVAIVSSGDATNTVWFAPSGTTSFVAGATMTTAGGTATSILAPATEGAYLLYVIDAAGNRSNSSGSTLTVDTTAPNNQDTVFAANVIQKGTLTVTIVSSGNGFNKVWLAPEGTTNFVAGATMTTNTGFATSIMAPATEGAYKLFVLDAAGNISNASTSTLTVDNTAPTVTNTRGDYSASTNTLVLTGTNYNTLLESSLFESASTDIKARLDWSKLTWDINGDDNTTGNVSFALGDISLVNVTDGTTLTIVLTSGKGTSLEAVTGYGGATLDTLDIAAGFARDVVGNVATTDAVVNAPLFTNAAPVVVDLNRDGAISYGRVVMDVNGDGVMDSTPWAGAQDGVLVWDKFADGMVHNNSQYAFTQYGGNTDLQGLAAAFDTNHDGKFNAQDAKFGEFMVWQDANQNGVSDAGEVRSLADLGLTEISLTSDNVLRTPADGVTEYGQTTATAADGTQVLVADVGFEYTSLGYSMGSDSAGLGTLKLADGAALNLAQVGKQSSHAVAVVDLLSDSAANALTLSLQDVLDLSGGNLFNSGTTSSSGTSATSAKQLAVLGDAQDTLHIGTGWTNSGTLVNYNGHDLVVYNSNTSAAQLLVEQAMVNANHVVI